MTSFCGEGVRHRREQATRGWPVRRCSGNDLLSHLVAQAVPSAQEGLTSGFGMGPGVSPPLWPPKRGLPIAREAVEGAILESELENHDSEREQKPSPRPISTGRLHALPRFHLRPINLVVFEGPYLVDPVGDLISGRVSHLDAFSAYLFRT